MNDQVQQQLIAARRAQILDAAAQVFASKGFHAATVRDVARAAGVADGTIYNYFGSKNDLLLALLDRLNESDQREAQFIQGTDMDFKAFFTAYLRHRLALLWPNADLLRATLPEMLVNPELRKRYYQQIIAPTTRVGEQFFRAQIAAGRMRPVDVPLAVRAMAGTLLGALLLQLLGDDELAARWEQLPEVLATMLLDGLNSGRA